MKFTENVLDSASKPTPPPQIHFK